MALCCWIHFGVLIHHKVAGLRLLSRQAKEANQIVAWPAMRREVVTFALKQADRCALGAHWLEPIRGSQSQLGGKVYDDVRAGNVGGGGHTHADVGVRGSRNLCLTEALQELCCVRLPQGSPGADYHPYTVTPL
jgi:hypothetical protein